MIEILKTYQTLIAAAIGFGGVIATIWWNGRRDRSARAERESRELQVLGCVLKRELEQIKQSTEDWTTDWARGAQGHSFPLPSTFVDLFQSYVERLGILPGQVAGPVVDAYVDYREFIATLWAKSEDSCLSITSVPGTLFVHIAPMEGESDIGSVLDELSKDFESVLRSLNLALSAIDRFAPGPD